MPNKSSKAGHIPLRRCVICREIKNKSELLRFSILDEEIIFDMKNNLSSFGYYVCDSNYCISKLQKWKIKRLKKKNVRKIE